MIFELPREARLLSQLMRGLRPVVLQKTTASTQGKVAEVIHEVLNHRIIGCWGLIPKTVTGKKIGGVL